MKHCARNQSALLSGSDLADVTVNKYSRQFALPSLDLLVNNKPRSHYLVVTNDSGECFFLINNYLVKF